MTFHWPYVLFALPLALAALLGLFALTSRARKRLLAQFAAERLLPSLLASYSPALRRLKLILLTTGILLVLFALARPQWGYDWEEKRARGVDVLFALDASKSMLAEDVLPNRLERAKLAIMDLVEKMPGNRVGLVAFAGQAFLQCPLTLDYDAFRQSLEAVDTNVIAVGGSNLAAAVAEAETALESSGNHKLVVLLTDGEDLAGEGAEAARAAEGRGVTIYTVGVGTPEGEIIPVRGADGRVDYVRDDNGQIVRSKLDAKTLASVAEVTNGFYVPLGATGEGLVQVYESGIKTLTQEALEARPQRRAIERFQWPLAIGLLLLALEPVIGTRRPAWRRNAQAASLGALSPAVSPAKSASSLAILMLAGFIALNAMPRAKAADAPVAQPAAEPAGENPPAAPPSATAESAPAPATTSPIAAQQLFAKGDYKAAADAYGQAAVSTPQDARMKFNQGASLYRAGEFAAAADAFGQALETNDLNLQQRAYYNLGNTRFRTGQAELKTDPKKTVSTWEAAVKDFQAALDLNPGDADARYNLDLVSKLLEQLKKQLEEQEKQQQQQQDQQQNQQQQDQPNQDQQQNSQNQQQQNQQDSPSQQQQNQSGQQGQQDQQNQSGQQNRQNGSPQQQNQNGSQESGQRQNQQPENQSGQSGAQQDQQRGQNAQNQSSPGQNGEQNPSNNQEQQNQRGQSGGQDQQENPSGQRENQPSPQRGQQLDRGQRGAQQNQPSSDRGSQRGELPQPSGERGQRQNQPARGQDAQNANQRGQSAGAASAAAGEKKDGEGGESVVIVPGVMTREEARQVLEALKVIEKKLPASNYDATKEGAAPPPAQSYRDW